MNRISKWTTLAALALLLTGCGKKQEAEAPPPEAAPRPVETRASVESLQMDPRVQFPEDRMPRSQELAENVAALASAVAGGDDAALGALLDAPSRTILADLVQTGEWTRATADIEAVRVVALEDSGEAAKVGLAVQDKSGAYLLAWAGAQAGDTWLFAGLTLAEQKTGARAADLDGASLAEEVIPEPRAEASRSVSRPPTPEEGQSRSRSKRRGGGGPGGPNF